MNLSAPSVEAIKVCTEMGFRPELALTRLQLTELLLEHYPDEKEAALEHLDFTIKAFQDMKTQLSLERAPRNDEILKAQTCVRPLVSENQIASTASGQPHNLLTFC